MNVAKTALVALVMAVVLSACGSSGGGSSSSSSTSPPTTEESSTASPTTDESSGGVATAKQGIAPLIGHPTPFPVTEDLERIPRGSTVTFVDSGTPISGLYWELLLPPAKMLGLKLNRVKAGSQASTVSSAFDSIVAQEPDAVIVPGINPELWQHQLKELQEKQIPIVPIGIVNSEEFGLEYPLAGRSSFEKNGKVVADYVTAEFGADSDVVVYEVPELPFSVVFTEAFEAELADVCPECSVRTTDVPIATIGNTAPAQIVSDLQANPDTTVAVFPNDEAQLGVPAALQAAGVKIKTIGEAPTPTNLQYLKEGKETAALGLDLPVQMWTAIDQTARLIIGQKLTGAEADGTDVVQQFLTGKDIADPKRGWTGYPDFAERFAKLWGLQPE